MTLQNKMLRIGIVGCGKIADQHIAAIDRLDNCKAVAACDREILMAKQLAERSTIEHCFEDLQEMLDQASIDVVHVTTPPRGHYPITKTCLENGVHVYLEKPFTVTADEAQDLIDIANSRNLCLTAGHNLQFTNEMLAMRRLVQSGYIGDPTHIESHFHYSLGDLTYVGPLLGDKTHWVRQLPGQLLHNIVSHPIAKIAEFLDSDIVEITAIGFQSAQLKSYHIDGVLDELRVLIRDSKGTTATVMFSTQNKPGVNQMRVYGSKNSLLVDHGSGILIRHDNGLYKSYLTYFAPPIKNGWALIKAGFANIWSFIRKRLHQDFGMKELIGQFYDSINNSKPPPIPYREILLTARIMDEVFDQIYSNHEMENKKTKTASP